MMRSFRIAIVGGRDFDQPELFKAVWFKNIFPVYKKDPIEIVSGGCPTGADKIAKEFALSSGSIYDYKEFAPNWEKFGRLAGPIRNAKIAAYSDIMVAFWDGVSGGTRDAIWKMVDIKKPVFIFSY